MSAPHIDWSPEQIGLLTQLWNARALVRDIARALHTTRGSIIGKAHRLNLPERPSPIIRTRSGFPKSILKAAKQVVIPLNTRKAPPPERPKLGRAIPEVIKPPKKFDGVPLSKYQCSWPIGDPGEPNYKTCEERALVKKPYCAEHCEGAYVKVPR